MDKGALGDRMKGYEKIGQQRLIPLLPAMARMDGKCFSSYTRRMNFSKPYDSRLSTVMGMVTKRLVEETGARLGYTQSDEITLVWHAENYKSQIFCDGKIHKMVSILASMTTCYFHEAADWPIALFDARVWNLPSQVEAVNALLWREADATTNSIESATRSVYSHAECLNKSCAEMQEMLFAKGLNWNDYPAYFKRGQYFQRHRVTRGFTAGELEQLPEKHAARTNPDLRVVRQDVRALDLPPLSQVTNRVGVVFGGQGPVMTQRALDTNKHVEAGAYA